MTHTADAPEVLWRPEPGHVADTKIAAFRQWLRAERGVEADDYRSLWKFSVDRGPDFWAAVADFLGVRWHDRPRAVLSGEMPSARWFEGGTLNYAEHSLSPGVAGAAKGDDELALIFHREDGLAQQLTYGRLRAQVAAGLSPLLETQVRTGDLVGVPWQLIVGPKGVADGVVELKRRATGERQTLPIEAAIKAIVG